jgi:uncharacterized protein YceK
MSMAKRKQAGQRAGKKLDRGLDLRRAAAKFMIVDLPFK